MRTKVLVISFVAAALVHGGIMLFGGLLFAKRSAARAKATEDIELTAPEQAKVEETKTAQETPREADDQTAPKPPELNESAPMDLGQLEMAMNPGMADGMGGDFGTRLTGFGERAEHAARAAGGNEGEGIFSIADLDQAPRVVFQPPPSYPPELRRRKVNGTVHVMFMVDVTGRVINPMVQKTPDPALERPALDAVRRWKFEPGKRNGQAVQFKMRVPITFMAS